MTSSFCERRSPFGEGVVHYAGIDIHASERSRDDKLDPADQCQAVN